VKKYDPVRYSSAVGAVWVMVTFKIKYCHKIFDFKAVRELCSALFNQAFLIYELNCKKLAYDSDHVHMILDMGLYSKPQIAKKLKGYVGKKLMNYMPWLKRNFFWGKGPWNPAYDIRSINDMNFYLRYLDKQKYACAGQKTLSNY